MIVRIACLLFASVWLTAAQSRGEEPAFKSNLAAGGDKLTPYGEKTNIDIIADESTGENVVRAVFDDSSPVTWCHKGIRVEFSEPIEWRNFDYVSAAFKVLPGAKIAGVQAHDTAGNFWDASFPDRPLEGEWTLANLPKEMFRFGHNEIDANAAPSDPSAPINYILIYFETLDVNSGTEYTALVKDVQLSREQQQ